jgi:hypothetical protein
VLESSIKTIGLAVGSALDARWFVAYADAMLTERPNLAWGELSVGVFVFFHSKAAPADVDWKDAMAALGRFANKTSPKAIVFTDGGAPTGPQRDELNRLVGKTPPTAVVTDALVVRFVVSSLALRNSSIATFSLSEFGDAWRHLGLNERDAAYARDELTLAMSHLSDNFKTARSLLKLR